MSLSVVPASGELLERILDDTHPVWGEGLDRAGYARYNVAQGRTPWGSAHLHRVALVDDGRLLATAKRYDLRVQVDGLVVDAIGLGAVFTPEIVRRQGHAGELIRRMLDAAAGEGRGWALLFSDIGPRYYERFGFRHVPITQVVLAVQPGKRAGAPAIPMRSGDSGDLRAITEMNAALSSGYRFALARDAEYVRQAIARKRLLAACGRPGHRKIEFFVVEEGGRAAAYVVLLEVGRQWMITECGDRDPSGSRVGAMLQALIARDAQQPERLRAWLPPRFSPPQLEIVARETPRITMMMRPLGREVRPDPPLDAGDVAWWHADAF